MKRKRRIAFPCVVVSPKGIVIACLSLSINRDLCYRAYIDVLFTCCSLSKRERGVVERSEPRHHEAQVRRLQRQSNWKEGGTEDEKHLVVALHAPGINYLREHIYEVSSP